MIIKNELNANSLIVAVKNCFSKVTDQRGSNSSISLADALMSGFAMFSLKEKSLLSFEHNITDFGPNLVNPLSCSHRALIISPLLLSVSE